LVAGGGRGSSNIGGKWKRSCIEKGLLLLLLLTMKQLLLHHVVMLLLLLLHHLCKGRMHVWRLEGRIRSLVWIHSLLTLVMWNRYRESLHWIGQSPR
jgi:hypothetical protein